MWCLKVKLGGVCILQFANVPRVLDAGCLHSQADTKIWCARLPSVADRSNHPGDAPLTKAPGHEDRIKIPQTIFVVIVHQLFGFDPLDIYAQVICYASVG